MKVLSFAASNSRKSINKQLVTYACKLLAERMGPKVEIETIDLNDYEMPLYSIDRENESGIPDTAHRFLKQVREADAILVSFAEHNGAYTVAYKNLYDWTSRIEAKVFEDKPMVLLATSPGARGGRNVLNIALEALPRFGADIRGSFSLSKFNDNFDREAGCLISAEHIEELIEALDGFTDKNTAAA